MKSLVRRSRPDVEAAGGPDQQEVVYVQNRQLWVAMWLPTVPAAAVPGAKLLIAVCSEGRMAENPRYEEPRRDAVVQMPKLQVGHQ